MNCRCQSLTPHQSYSDCIDYLQAKVSVLEAVISGEELSHFDALLHPAAEERYRIQRATEHFPGDRIREDCA